MTTTAPVTCACVAEPTVRVARGVGLRGGVERRHRDLDRAARAGDLVLVGEQRLRVDLARRARRPARARAGRRPGRGRGRARVRWPARGRACCGRPGCAGPWGSPSASGFLHLRRGRRRRPGGGTSPAGAPRGSARGLGRRISCAGCTLPAHGGRLRRAGVVGRLLGGRGELPRRAVEGPVSAGRSTRRSATAPTAATTITATRTPTSGAPTARSTTWDTTANTRRPSRTYAARRSRVVAMPRTVPPRRRRTHHPRRPSTGAPPPGFEPGLHGSKGRRAAVTPGRTDACTRRGRQVCQATARCDTAHGMMGAWPPTASARPAPA